MLLSEFLEQAEVKRARIQVIGRLKTKTASFKVLGIAGQTVLPIPEIFHLIPDDPDPELDEAEIASIRRRFRLGKTEFRTPR